MTHRVTLPRPWIIVEHDESFEVRAANDVCVAYLYFDEGDPIRQSVRRRMDRTTALAVAKAVAKIGG